MKRNAIILLIIVGVAVLGKNEINNNRKQIIQCIENGNTVNYCYEGGNYED